MVSEREAAASPVAFVGDGGEAGRKGEGEGSAAASAVRVNPLAMIQECLTLNLECSLDRVDGQLCVLFPMRNCRVAASAPSGLCSRSRKKEPYSVGDIWRLLFTPKEQYVFNYVQNSGNRYINVLERPRITLAIKAMPPLPPSKHANLEPPPGAAAAAAAAHEEATRNGDLELVNAVLNTAVEALPIDPALPVDVCGFAAAETPEAPALNPEAEDSAKRRRPAAWLLPVGLEGETDFFAWQTRGALAALEEEAGAEGGAVVEEETAAEGRCGVEGTREKAFALCVLRMQRPLVQRSASILTQGVFEEVLENLRSVVAAKRSRKSLDAFTYRPRPGASAGDASKVSGANYGAEARGQSALSAAASLGEEKRQSLSQPASHPAAYRRRFEATRAATASRSGLHPRPPPTSRLCVIDEICSKRRRRPIILVPSLAASGGVACLLTSCNARALLEGGKFVSARDAQREAAAQGTAIGREGVIISHRIRHHEIQFSVVECTYASKYRRQDWECVVAVVVNASSAAAAQWQFHKWPFKDFTDLFLFYKGFVFAFEEEAVPPEVTQWNTTVLRLSRSRRYNDEAAAGDFWRSLSEFLLRPRPSLILDGGSLTPGAAAKT